MEDGMQYFVGIDWGSKAHAVCVLKQNGERFARFQVLHDADGVAELVSRLETLRGNGPVRIAIERPNGTLVEALVAAGHDVVPIRPDALKGFLVRYTANSAKDDNGDAYVLADVLRSDGARLASLAPQTGQMLALQRVVRYRNSVIRKRVRAVNELEALLKDFWPGALELFDTSHSRIFLKFIHRFASPLEAAELDEAGMAAFLKQARYSGGTKASQLMAAMRSAAPGAIDPHRCEVMSRIVRSLAEEILTHVDAEANVTKLLRQEYAKHPDFAIFDSLPCGGDQTAPRILAEMGDQRDRFPTLESFLGTAGTCPVTIASGKRRDVRFRRACNEDLRVAVSFLADNARRTCPRSIAIYTAKRAEGKSHQATLRIIARLWLRVIYRLWIDRVPYDATKHRSHQHAA
jgi:transposase